MNYFLKTKQEIIGATKWLQDNNYTTHPISCKDWELATVIERLEDGDLIDLGADGSFVLHNAIKKNIKGRKVGVDLIEVTGDNKAEGVEYYQQDIMSTMFNDGSFDMAVSLSVIEHEVNFSRFAKECGRLLRKTGKAIVSFDFWHPKPDYEKRKLYNLDWNILDHDDVINLISEFTKNDLILTSEIDWTTQDAVINPQYCSPADVSYTFSILEFIKK